MLWTPGALEVLCLFGQTQKDGEAALAFHRVRVLMPRRHLLAVCAVISQRLKRLRSPVAATTLRAFRFALLHAFRNVAVLLSAIAAMTVFPVVSPQPLTRLTHRKVS